MGLFMLQGLNHLTITVRSLKLSLDFYSKVLGFKPIVKWRTGAYLSLGDVWLCLAVGTPKPAGDYSHIAFSLEQDSFGTMGRRLGEAGVPQWQENSSEGGSYYIEDPDGHKLELHVGTLRTRLDHLREEPYAELVWF